MICTTTSCEEITCEVGQRSQTVSQSRGGGCCPEQVCVPAGEDCQPLVRPECGAFQEVKLVVGQHNNCPRLICECAECPAVAPPPPTLEEGEDLQLETSGCCPVTRVVCRPETCPPPTLECSHHLVRLRDFSQNNSCCPKYKCGEY